MRLRKVANGDLGTTPRMCVAVAEPAARQIRRPPGRTKTGPVVYVPAEDSYLFWIYFHGGGAKAVADYLLAQLEIGMMVDEAKRAMTLVRQCQKLMHGRPYVEV